MIDLELFWNLLKEQGMDQVGINFEWHRGAQFHQEKRASNTFRFALVPPAAANGQNRLSVSL